MATGGNRICSVVACSGDTIDTCGKRFPNFEQNTTGIFEELSIIATVPTPVIDTYLKAADSTFYPVSLDIKIMPLEPQDYTFTLENSNNMRVTTYNFTLNKQNSDLYSFAVWGRVFGTDGEEASPPVKDGSNPSFTGNLSTFLLIPFIAAIMQ
ncbi:unnamed protein product [Parnassius apollo]|uniref:(apollo) hypothetical protein n=1 Tax=Parnassius apollo TaxID=110799 RepID=A0A8S3XI16_PARAO|nr:unnamed protein product [Parnassius apollo]